MLKTVLREQVESVHGCGRLIYEILRGVNGQLHNSAAEIFAHVLEVLVNKDSAHTKDQTELLGDIVEYSLGLLLNFCAQTKATFCGRNSVRLRAVKSWMNKGLST